MVQRSNGSASSSGDRPETPRNTGRWTAEEHELFLSALEKVEDKTRIGEAWKTLGDVISSRTVVQIRTHAQKYFKKLQKAKDGESFAKGTMSLPDNFMEAPAKLSTSSTALSSMPSPPRLVLSRASPDNGSKNVVTDTDPCSPPPSQPQLYVTMPGRQPSTRRQRHQNKEKDGNLKSGGKYGSASWGGVIKGRQAELAQQQKRFPVDSPTSVDQLQPIQPTPSPHHLRLLLDMQGGRPATSPQWQQGKVGGGKTKASGSTEEAGATVSAPRSSKRQKRSHTQGGGGGSPKRGSGAELNLVQPATGSGLIRRHHTRHRLETVSSAASLDATLGLGAGITAPFPLGDVTVTTSTASTVTTSVGGGGGEGQRGGGRGGERGGGVGDGTRYLV